MSMSGLRLGFRRLTSASPGTEKPSRGKPRRPVKDVKVDVLPIHILGSIDDAVTVYEQLFVNCRRITIRYLDALGDAQLHRRAAATPRSRSVSARTKRWLERDDRVFSGFESAARLLLVPEQVHRLQAGGFAKAAVADRCAGLRHAVRMPSRRRPRLASIVSPKMFALYTVAGRQSVRDELQPRAGAPRRTRAPRRSGPQPHARVRGAPHHRRLCALSWRARKRSRSIRSTACRPRMSGRPMRSTTRAAGCRAAERSQERRSGALSAYAGTELFLSLSRAGWRSTIANACASSACARLASNRHLADQLPVGEAGADFYPGRRHVGPASLRCRLDAASRIAGHAGAPAHRRGAVRRDAVEAHQFPDAQPSRHLSTTTTKDRAGALRELLALFADLSDSGLRAADPRHRGRLQPSDRAAAAPEERLQRGARHRDHRTLRREGVRGHRRLPARRGARPLLCRIHVDQQLHRDGDRDQAARPHQTLAAARRQRGGCCDVPRASSETSPGASTSSQALRELERSAERKPRIGDSAVAVRRGRQSRPGSVRRISGVERVEISRIRRQGSPQALLPLPRLLRSARRASAQHHGRGLPWSNGRDPSFARFTDIFGNRFLQLFFRAWANARPIAHHDRPEDDRFVRYVGTFAGIGADSLNGRDSLDDIAKLPFAGLVNARRSRARRA